MDENTKHHCRLCGRSIKRTETGWKHEGFAPRHPALPSLNMDDYERIPIKEITTPRQGRICFLDMWWQTDGENVLFYTADGDYSPQCNSDRSAVNRTKKPKFGLKFIPVAFVPQRAAVQ